MKRIYLSGPMTGLPDLNFAAFHAMTTNLRAGGHTVTNPAEINPNGGTWNDCMRRDIVALMDCETVATLPGWEHSKGARLEVLIAEHLGMKVVNAHDLVTSHPINI
ncbi:DUF4406 domain-containing protein [Pseudomonas tolaasii]|uniref:DUF4406 domain-containing protein n=2 Tax=Pseudomonas tolaasii TaxID=29442 RepID=A0A7Y8ASN8_PSETO|nr:DUF4406 domain-containing protein [Pseudomonas tolaasii]ARB27262.1 hypothetical protein B5P22_08235 [Pseudomonas tolaasii]KAB0466770.1 DUF4406 domain-containing protein [Pseudomonas tolaasii]MBY8942456.1 DUF4406 domain-containing protein [Pseudomonas tolaasii]NWC24100.1 DUF4406 domain-containing protein [Pseudomonas tolaasii]NWC37770.1 DUF4406 domain-containing protein [Pseudomonas tolaasii]